MPRQRAIGRFLAGGRKSTAPYLNQSAAKLNTALSRFSATTYKKSRPFYHVSQVVAAQRLEKNKFSTRQRARIVCTAHARAARSQVYVRVCVRGSNAISNGVKPAKSAADRKRTVGRKRPRRRGQNRAACVATAVLTRNATIGRNANRAIPGPSKSKSTHSTRSCARLQAYRWCTEKHDIAQWLCYTVGAPFRRLKSTNVRFDFSPVYVLYLRACPTLREQSSTAPGAPLPSGE